MQSRTLTQASIRTLTAADIDRLRFSDWARTTYDEIKLAVERYPGRSIWIPETDEYAIVAPWRHRPEIANVVELSAVRHPTEMLDEVIQRAARHGANAVVAMEMDEARQPAFYGRAGFELLERVVTYEYFVRGDEAPHPGWLEARLIDPARRADRDLLVKIDRATFPWLWWNCEAEFQVYTDAPGTEAFVCSINGEPVSYIALTAFLGWGHVDRIGVLPSLQGRGVGLATLRLAVNRLAQFGARRVGLSTQLANERSRRLYERFGFRRADANDYRVYGRVLTMPAGLERIT